MTNCPNCGTPISGSICEYCGTIFYDFSVLDADKPFWITIKYGNSLLKATVYIGSFSATVKQEPDLEVMNMNGTCYRIQTNPVLKLDLSMISVGDLTTMEREK